LHFVPLIQLIQPELILYSLNFCVKSSISESNLGYQIISFQISGYKILGLLLLHWLHQLAHEGEDLLHPVYVSVLNFLSKFKLVVEVVHHLEFYCDLDHCYFSSKFLPLELEDVLEKLYYLYDFYIDDEDPSPGYSFYFIDVVVNHFSFLLFHHPLSIQVSYKLFPYNIIKPLFFLGIFFLVEFIELIPDLHQQLLLSLKINRYLTLTFKLSHEQMGLIRRDHRLEHLNIFL
jgi:hypothetical protein